MSNEIVDKNSLYKYTEILLEKYRDAQWSIEVSKMQMQMMFDVEESQLDDFMKKAYEAGANLDNTEIHEQIRTMNKNKQMLEIIDKSVEMLRKLPEYGEKYYCVIYYTYICNESFSRTDDIIGRLAEQFHISSSRTYFKHRKLAIEKLSKILWRFSVKNNVLNEFIK